MTNYRRGYDVECWAVEELKQEGYRAARTAGSHGTFDVVAVGPKCVRLLQIKRVKGPGSVNGALVKGEKEILRCPCPPGVVQEVWVWLDKKGWVVKKVVEGDAYLPGKTAAPAGDAI